MENQGGNQYQDKQCPSCGSTFSGRIDKKFCSDQCRALADILFGDVNPSGKLPYTYPRYPNALVSYIHKPSKEQKKAEGGI